MADFGRWNPNWNPDDGGQPSLQDIHRSEQFIEALSTGRPVYANDPGEDELAYLMAGWRDRARNAPMRATITEQDAVAALQRGLPRPRGGAPRPGRRFSLTVVGSAAAAVICLGGFGALVAGAGPGDPLYGLRTMLFGDVVRDDPVVLAAQTQLAEVEQLIAQGDWEAAQERLQAVTTTVATVGDETRKQELVAEWQELSVKVESRNPDATVPPDAPPVTLPVIDPATSTEPTEPDTPSTEPAQPGEPTEPGDPDMPVDGTEPTSPGTEPTDGPDQPTVPPTAGPTSEPATSEPAVTAPTSAPTTTVPTSAPGSAVRTTTSAPTTATTTSGSTTAGPTAGGPTSSGPATGPTSVPREPGAGAGTTEPTAPAARAGEDGVGGDGTVGGDGAFAEETVGEVPQLTATTTVVLPQSGAADAAGD